VIEKEPSAELRAGQRDTDSLPPYPILDPILRAYVEGIVALGFEREMAKNVIARVDRNEYIMKTISSRHKDYSKGIGE
jgi:NAD+ synthase (glutamine-hydrolysing)